MIGIGTMPEVLNRSQVRDNFKSVAERALHGQPTLAKGPGGRDVIILSADDFRELLCAHRKILGELETLKIRSDRERSERLKSSMDSEEEISLDEILEEFDSQEQ